MILIQYRCTSNSSDLTYEPESTHQERAIKKVHLMDGSLAYRRTGMLFDIAIIEVDTPFDLTTAVVPAKLPTARTPVGTNVTVSGWGRTLEGNLR
jgi:hypothetical protein